jgi:hypothetical protein
MLVLDEHLLGGQHPRKPERGGTSSKTASKLWDSTESLVLIQHLVRCSQGVPDQNRNQSVNVAGAGRTSNQVQTC